MKSMYLGAVPVLALLISSCSGSSQAKVSLPTENPAKKLDVVGKDETSQTENKEAVEASAPQASAPMRAPSQRIQGQVTSRARSQVGFKVAGFVESIAVQPGDRVKKGEVLARLEKADFELNLQLAQARLEQARVNLRSAERDFAREDGLSKAKATTEAALERTQNALDQAKIAVKLATLEVSKAKRSLDDAVLRAPYDCLVSKQQKFAGEYAGVGAPVLDIQETLSQEIVLSVPERYIGNIKVGRQIAIVIPSTQYRGSAQITRVVDLVSEKTRTFEVYAEPSDGDKALTTGLFVEAEIN